MCVCVCVCFGFSPSLSARVIWHSLHSGMSSHRCFHVSKPLTSLLQDNFAWFLSGFNPFSTEAYICNIGSLSHLDSFSSSSSASSFCLSFYLSIFKIKRVIIISLSSSQKLLWRMLWAADAILSRRSLADRLNQPEIILQDFGFSSVNMHEQPQSKQDVLRCLSSGWETLRYGRHIWPVTGAGTLLMDTPLKAQE